MKQIRRVRRVAPENARSRGFVGIDPSMAGFAVALALESGPVSIELLKTSAPPEGAFVRPRFARWDAIARFVVEQVRTLGTPSPLIAIEQYAFSKGGPSLGELGGVYRSALLAHFPDAEFVEVAPTTLKKFLSGQGNASKARMVAAVARLHPDLDIDNDDVVDAFGLLEIGRALAGVTSPYVPHTEARLSVAARVKRPPR
jgi:Holliday junction resolvasome RuvABC endonuclease subunit